MPTDVPTLYECRVQDITSADGPDQELDEGTGSKDRGAKKQRAPVGVTIIADDEDEVQLGMQKAMRMPR